MAAETLEANGSSAKAYANRNGTNGVHLPGTTIPDKTATNSPPLAEETNQLSAAASSLPRTLPGPTIDGRKTYTTLYEPSQLAGSSVIPALHRLINYAFDYSHKTKGCEITTLRLPTEADYLRQVGTDPGTFVYIVTWADSGEPVATAGAHHYAGTVWMSEEARASERSAFTRVKLPAAAQQDGMEVWELKLMAVDVGFSGKGLASYLMKLVDEEVLRRRSKEPARLYMVLTTVTEANGPFYLKRGYVEDYETAHGPGFMGTPNGFHVVHMSRLLRE